MSGNVYFYPNQFRGFYEIGVTKNEMEEDVYLILHKIFLYLKNHPDRTFEDSLENLNSHEIKVLDNAMLIDPGGSIDISKINPETLFGVNNIGISDSFSFWAWRRTVVWKNTGEKKSTQILKHIAAQGAFLGIGAVGCVETVGRFLGRPIAAGINYLRYKEFDNRPNTAVRLSATATVEAITGLVTNFFPRDFEATACSGLAKGVMKITKNRLTL
ncbi:MAG: hypothetical protein KR126chlam6_00463 [Candidatus Anoxychlamydiales bacterium]|nr:hypothetical protein [Candidatus Anoxychlamydiales bacterium]